MTKEIAYQGYSAVPSDYENPDGQLAASLNLIHEDGALHPVAQPTDLAVLPVKSDETTPQDIECSVVFIHKTESYTHYIVARKAQYTPIVGGGEYDGYGLYWFDGSVITNATSLPVTINDYTSQQNPKLQYITLLTPSLPIPYQTLTNGPSIRKVEAIGNTLIVLADDGIHYILWNGTEYKYLGNHLPELPLSFGLQGEGKLSEEFFVDFTQQPNAILIGELPHVGYEKKFSDNWSAEIPDSVRKSISNAVLGKINKFIEEESTNNGKFLFPFFVRYAYRLYDGSLTMHSAPVLMVPSSKYNPHAFITDIDTTLQGGYYFINGFTTKIGAIVCDLDYQCIDENCLSAISEWTDIITSVDIFVSAPVYTYKQSGEVSGFLNYTKDVKGFTISKIANGGYENQLATDKCIATYGEPATELSPYSDYYKQGMIEFIIPQETDESVKEKLLDRGLFYFLKSIPVSEISTERNIIDIAKDYLQSLVAREVMTDDYDSHDILMPKNQYVYNSRLNIADIKKRLSPPSPLITCVPYTNVSTDDYLVHVFIKEDGREYVMTSTSSELGYWFVNYFYYPNPHAYNVVIENSTTASLVRYMELPLKPHNILNGAVFCNGIDNTGTSTTEPEEDTTDNTIVLPNKIYTSDVNNPFFFPVTGINTVGSGTILAMSAATKALSQGQFGQFPLYVFSDDGVWALEVSPTGTFTSSHPVTRDVCINADSITQIDTAVLFSTDRGIMLVQGSDTVCISDALFSEHPFDVLDLPHASVLHTMLGHNTDTCLPTKPFIGFLSGCQMLYDYVHQHIIVYNPSKTVSEGVTTYDYTYAYVYSLKSKEWGMMYSNVKSGVNAYPEAMAMTHDGHLVSFARADNDNDNDYKGLFITRPIKLGNPDVLKSIHTVIQRGMCLRGDVNTVLWGSRDLYNWYLIGSSTDNAIRNLRGTPYKYFRIGGVATLPNGKSLFGVSVEAEPRHTSVMQ